MDKDNESPRQYLPTEITTTRSNGTRRVQTRTENGQGRTRKDFQKDADINVIVERWKRTGELPPIQQKAPLYADFTGELDYQDQLDRIITAQDHFDALPAEVRAAAENNPAVFLRMMDSEEGRASLAEAGLQIATSDPTEKATSGARGEPLESPSGSPPRKPPTTGNEGLKSDSDTSSPPRTKAQP